MKQLFVVKLYNPLFNLHVASWAVRNVYIVEAGSIHGNNERSRFDLSVNCLIVTFCVYQILSILNLKHPTVIIEWLYIVRLYNSWYKTDMLILGVYIKLFWSRVCRVTTMTWKLWNSCSFLNCITPCLACTLLSNLVCNSL